ncbi:MAG: EamA family transporter [Halobacteriales archaeon]
MNYVLWALLALACYSFVAPLVSIGTQGGVPSDVAVLIVNGILVVIASGVIIYRGGDFITYLDHPKMPFLYAAGLFLTVGILSYYRALSMGPVSIVVPIFGLFIVVSSLIGIVLLDESITVRKIAGIGFALVAVYLTSME